MNSFERIMTAMKLKEADRVPMAEFVIDPSIYKALMPDASSQSDFEAAFELDTVSARANYPPIKDDGSIYTDEWGITYKRNKEMVAHPISSPFPRDPDVEPDLEGFTPPRSDVEERYAALPDIVKKFKGRKAIIFHQRACLLWAINVRGLDTFLIDLYERPEFVHRLLDKILEGQIELARTAIRKGADIIAETDDYAYNSGPLFSPAMFREFIFPRLKKFVDAVHEEGGLIVKHTDGNIMALLDDMVECGIDGLHSIDPIAGMDLGVVKQKYGHRISLWGNIDCGPLLSYGTPEEVEKAVKNCIKAAAPGGGYILQSSNSITTAAKPENYEAMLRAGKQYGGYPIDFSKL